MAELRILPPAAKFLKKLKDKKIEGVIMAGTRDNFYDELKRYWL